MTAEKIQRKWRMKMSELIEKVGDNAFDQLEEVCYDCIAAYFRETNPDKLEKLTVDGMNYPYDLLCGEIYDVIEGLVQTIKARIVELEEGE